MKKNLLFLALAALVLMGCDDKNKPEDLKQKNYLQVAYSGVGKTATEIKALLTEKGFTYEPKSELYVLTLQDERKGDPGLGGRETAVLRLEYEYEGGKASTFSLSLQTDNASKWAELYHPMWSLYAKDTVLAPISLWGGAVFTKYADMPEVYMEGGLKTVLEAYLLAAYTNGQIDEATYLEMKEMLKSNYADYKAALPGIYKNFEMEVSEIFVQMTDMMSGKARLGFLTLEKVVEDEDCYYELLFEYLGEEEFSLDDIFDFGMAPKRKR